MRGERKRLESATILARRGRPHRLPLLQVVGEGGKIRAAVKAGQPLPHHGRRGRKGMFGWILIAEKQGKGVTTIAAKKRTLRSSSRNVPTKGEGRAECGVTKKEQPTRNRIASRKEGRGTTPSTRLLPEGIKKRGKKKEKKSLVTGRDDLAVWRRPGVLDNGEKGGKDVGGGAEESPPSA